MGKKMLCCQKFYSMVVTTTFAVTMATILGISDSLLAGILIGEEGIAAINMVSPLFLVGTFFAGLISIGSGFVFSKAIGEFNIEKGTRIFSMSITFSAILGVIIGLLMFGFQNVYFNILGVSQSAKEMAEQYYFWIMLSNIVYPARMVLSEFVTTEGDEKITSLSYFVQIFGNLILSIVLCRIIGIAGIGLGTFLGTVLSILINCLHFFKKNNNLHYHFSYSSADLKEMLKFSIADSSLYLFIAVTDYVLNLYVIRAFGEMYLPVLAVAMFVIQFTISFDGIGTAFSPLINVYLGEKNYEVCEDFMKHVIKIAIIEGIVVMLLFFLGAPFVVKCFAVENPAVYSAAVLGVRIVALAMPAAAVLITIVSLYNICGHVFITTILEAFEQTILPCVLALIGGTFLGIKGLWIGYVLAFYLTIIGGYYVLCKAWGKENAPLFLPEKECLSKTFHITLTQNEIMEMNGQMEQILEEQEVGMKASMRIQLFIEELGMMLVEKCNGKEILSEWTFFFDEKIKLVVRYGGEEFDLTNDLDDKDDSVRMMVLSKLMDAQEDKRYLMSTGLNRCAFSFDK